jgi:hypothetical protein
MVVSGDYGIVGDFISTFIGCNGWFLFYKLIKLFALFSNDKRPSRTQSPSMMILLFVAKLEFIRNGRQFV